MIFKAGDEVLKKAKQSRRVGVVSFTKGDYAIVEWPDGTGDAYKFDTLRKKEL